MTRTIHDLPPGFRLARIATAKAAVLSTVVAAAGSPVTLSLRHAQALAGWIDDHCDTSGDVNHLALTLLEAPDQPDPAGWAEESLDQHLHATVSRLEAEGQMAEAAGWRQHERQEMAAYHVGAL